MSTLTFQEVHIENTNSCAYKCKMCPRESQTRQIGFMSLQDFALVLEKIQSVQWVGSKGGIFHLHGFGEPLLDRQLIPKIHKLRTHFPEALSVIFSTLGVKVSEDYFLKLLESGLQAIIVSFYGFTGADYKNIHGYDGLERVKHNLLLLSQAMQKIRGSFKAIIKIPSLTLQSAIPIAQPPESVAFCRWATDLGFEIKEWTYVHNYGDGRSYNKPKDKTLCPVISGLRKQILNITWDLNVIPCCYDFNATIQFGNLREQSLEEIFSSLAYLKFVIAQQTNSLADYSICQNCEKSDYH